MYASVSVAADQLPRGRHNLSREVVATDQRRRMLAAITTVFADYGYAQTTVSLVLAQARVSRRTFYEQFEDKDACLLAAYVEAQRRVWERAAAAARTADAWPSKVGAALDAALDFVVAEPAVAHLFTLEARAASSAIAAGHRDVLDRLALILRTGNRASLDSAGLPWWTERALVDQVAALVGAYVLSGAVGLLPSLGPQLLEHLLTPYREGGLAVPRRISAAASRGPT